MNMTFKDYSEFVKSTSLGPAEEMNYTILGLCGETGEVAEKFKKLIRDHNSILT